ncbi:MAG: slipin family protein, partial [Proteobacteria bacterium]|nr:slipin family protein [Pseudomonadota bacterium]
MGEAKLFGFLIFLAVILALFFFGVRILPEYERGVVFRLGRFAGVRSAGFRWIIPGVDRMVRIGLREIVMDVPAQEVITLDNVSVKVNAVLYFRVLHPEKAVIQVENYLYGTSHLAQT